MLKMKGIQMVSNHGLTVELNKKLNEFNGVTAPEGEGFFFCLLGLLGIFVFLFFSVLFGGSQLERAFPRSWNFIKLL